MVLRLGNLDVGHWLNSTPDGKLLPTLTAAYQEHEYSNKGVRVIYLYSLATRGAG